MSGRAISFFLISIIQLMQLTSVVSFSLNPSFSASTLVRHDGKSLKCFWSSSPSRFAQIVSNTRRRWNVLNAKSFTVRNVLNVFIWEVKDQRITTDVCTTTMDKGETSTLSLGCEQCVLVHRHVLLPKAVENCFFFISGNIVCLQSGSLLKCCHNRCSGNLANTI